MTLKTEYKYIRFEERIKGLRISGQGFAWFCINKKIEVILGKVVYFDKWETFVFQPSMGTEFSTDCLKDITDFLEQLNQQKRKGIPCESSKQS